MTGGNTLHVSNLDFRIDEAAAEADQSLACHGTELCLHHQAPVLQLGQTMRWQAKKGGFHCHNTASLSILPSLSPSPLASQLRTAFIIAIQAVLMSSQGILEICQKL